MSKRNWAWAMCLAMAVSVPASAQPAAEHTKVSSVSPHRWMGPPEAIMVAKKAAPLAVTGVFTLTVQAVGRDRGRAYLNSKPDYKDPACLTIDIGPQVIGELERRLGGSLETVLQGKTVAVAGAVKRLAIVNEDRPKKVTYYQTHVFLLDPKELRIVTEEERDAG